MQRSPSISQSGIDGSQSANEGWVRVGVLAGFLATFAMTVVLAAAYGLSAALGNPDGWFFERWLWALSHNPVATHTADGVLLAIGANLAIGLVFALIYTRWFAERLSGPGWWNGMRFALIPWALSLLVFLPLMGGGVLGLAIGAGPLPIVGNLLLHLVYGATLGAIVALAVGDGLDDTAAERANATAAERGAAVGVAVGLIAGAIIGWLGGPAFGGIDSRAASAIGVALILGAAGLALGSFAGMDRYEVSRQR
ncbi:MAG TPA: hypothetical protein VFX03_16945 [Thermomicrobiales bacterium]|nr:hypothetical protein [Thermomicrobiales bacterium]